MASPPGSLPQGFAAGGGSEDLTAGVEHNCCPVAQTRRTMNDYSLKRSPDVQRESRTVGGDALRAEVGKTRVRRKSPVITAPARRQGTHGPYRGGRGAGLIPDKLRQRINALQEQLGALRSHMDPAVWRLRFERPLAQLADLIGHYNDADREQARQQLTDRQRQMVDDLVDGRLDFR
ncbi:MULTISPECIES: hypothetical protein [Streptomyces]|uniref:hypothetical protein n=1 Tax=Streptomyces TaxID=1883 RepID=UPI0004CCA6A4|nr:hypothetical protein [Streptomyces durhamensis]